MGLLNVIRKMALREQLPIREIARRTGLSRNTIRKYLKAGTVEPKFTVPERPSKLDPFADKLAAWLKTEASKSCKQRRPLTHIHADLVALGYTGSYNRVAAFAREWRMPADCEGKDNTVGVDVTRLELYRMDSVYRGVEELAQIFDVSEAGAAMVEDLRAREAAAIEKAEGLDLPEGASALFWFSSAEMDIDPYVAGQGGAPAYMMNALGLQNVVESNEEWPTVSWETIARANPTVIVVARMERRRFPADDVEKKLEFLKTDPVASEMDAVRNGRIVILDAHGMDPSIRNVASLETLADALADFELE